MRALLRVNAVVHGISAVYALILEAIPALLLRPLSFTNRGLFLVLIGIATFGLLDAAAVLKQWRHPGSGMLLSISLHLVAFAAVVAIITMELLGRPESRSLWWFVSHDFTFIICLAAVRAILAGTLLIKRSSA